MNRNKGDYEIGDPNWGWPHHSLWEGREEQQHAMFPRRKYIFVSFTSSQLIKFCCHVSVKGAVLGRI